MFKHCGNGNLQKAGAELMLITAVSTTDPRYLMTSHVCFWQCSRKLFLFLFSVLKLLLYDTTSEYAQKLWNFIVYHENQVELETFSYQTCAFLKIVKSQIYQFCQGCL